jgi:tubulin polyglutamylase TTLL5
MSTNYDIELSSNDSENDSDSTETLMVEKTGKTKHKYLRFYPDALKYITINNKLSIKNPTKYTSKGFDHNMCFKMIKSDSRLVKSILYSYGFTQCSRKNANVNFIWANTHMNGETLRTFLPWQRINHFPRSVAITKKDLLHQSLTFMRKGFGSCYDFYPESFVLPADRELLDGHYADRETFPPLISKPATSSRGRGIQIVTDIKQIDSIEANDKSKNVLSEYISNPYLVNGRKFDLRLYVTVTSFQPLIVYMFDDGLTRFAVDEYTDDDSTFAETFKHLTNYSLNKFSENFIKNTDPTQEDVGHKWTVSALLRHLSKEGVDTKLLMVRMEDIVIKTLLSIQPQVSAACRSTGLGPNVCFELFGFDILIDDDLKPWLLEVNLSPSLACDAPLDSILKTRVLCDTLNLAMVPLVLDKNSQNVVAGNEENLMESNDNDAVSSISASPLPASRSTSPSVTSASKKMRAPFRKTNSIEKRRPYNPGARVKIYANRLRLDKSRKGNFIRIFPRKDTFYLYKHMIEELDFRHEKQDMQLYKAMFDEDPDKYYVDADTNETHQELLDAKKFKTSADLSSETLGFLQEALDEAAQYEAEKHANGYRIYPKSLPRLHPYARRRTASQVTADEVRRQARLEALIINPLEEAILKSSSLSNLLSEVKKSI